MVLFEGVAYCFHLKIECGDHHVTCRWATLPFDVWIKCCVIFKCSALSGPTSAEQTDFSEKWANAGLDVGGTIILRRMRGSGAYFRIWSARQRSMDLMSDTLLTAIIEGQIITGYQSDVEHSHTSLLWGWGLQQTSIRQCERSAGRGNMLMTVTKPVLWFTFHLLLAFSFVPLHLKRNKAHMMNSVLRYQ